MTATSGPIAVEALGTVLGVWAHPDDECYLMAGTAMTAASTGATVACLTATAGEAGESADEERWPRARLGELRRDEMAIALELLGIDDHTWLDLPDGGLTSIDHDRGVELVAAVVDRVRPDTILTFGPDGMTGHPDHVVIGTWATEAARLVGDPGCQVLLATKGDEWLSRFADVNEAFGFELPRAGFETLALHVGLEGAPLDRKVAALDAQASQTSGLSHAMGRDVYRSWVADEFWAIAG